MSHLLDTPPSATGPSGGRGRAAFKLVLALVVIVALLVAAAAVAKTLLQRDPEAPDYPGTGTGKVVVQVKPGDNLSAVGSTLLDKGVVRSVAAFREATADEPDATKLQPGYYTLRAQMSATSALDLLLDPASRLRGLVAVPEGFRVEQTLARIAERTDISLADLKAAAAAPEELGLPAYAEGRLEGFLFPATYEIEPGTTAVQALQMMVRRFEQAATTVGLEAKARALGRTPYEVVTVASLIEREVRYDEELPKVAQVVYNRLEQRETLGIDAAILYGLGRTSGALKQSELDKVTPYNLRKVRGLPPTPISSPGEKTLAAALNPTGGDILFYVLATKDGHSVFTSTLADHNRAVAKARAEGIF
ncbi:MAG: putative periplasmic solute-binding protein [Frankiales bacterium]|nr:putative periplasmic solute-binding protein [Frankiales bacterium]